MLILEEGLNYILTFMIPIILSERGSTHPQNSADSSMPTCILVNKRQTGSYLLTVLTVVSFFPVGTTRVQNEVLFNITSPSSSKQ